MQLRPWVLMAPTYPPQAMVIVGGAIIADGIAFAFKHDNPMRRLFQVLSRVFLLAGFVGWALGL